MLFLRDPAFIATPPLPAPQNRYRRSRGPIAHARLETLKICAVTTPADAELVTRVAAKYLPAHTELLLGMILWPNTKRAVPRDTARAIAAAARAGGATPVAVFVDEAVDEIAATCAEIGVTTAQLHGAKAKEAWRGPVAAANGLKYIEVRSVSPEGSVDAPMRVSDPHPPKWVLYDAKGGGTGEPFDWNTFSPPQQGQPWLLAGGLDPDNVEDAVSKLAPTGLDVATGVAGPDRVRKDADRLERFLQRAVHAYS